LYLDLLVFIWVWIPAISTWKVGAKGPKCLI
jgi:hypothetical protein